MVCRNECERGVPDQDLLGQRWKDLKDIDNRSEPEPDLDPDCDNLPEIPEKNHEHREEKPKGIREELLDEIDHGNKQKVRGERVPGYKEYAKKYHKRYYKGNGL